MQIDQAFQLALQHHQAGQLPQAENLYRQILTQHPKHAGALHYLGILAGQTGRYDIATDLIGQSISLRPSAEAFSNLASALRAAGRLDEAAAAARQAISLNPNDPHAHNNLGTLLDDIGQPTQAIAAYRQAIFLNPNFAPAHSNLGASLRDAGQLEEAITSLRQAILLDPNNAQAHYNLGNALTDKRELERAIAAYRRAIALKPNYLKAASNLSHALTETGQLDEAITSARQAIALNPTLPEPHNHLGNALKAAGNLDDAIAAYRQAISLTPSPPQAFSNLLLTMHYHPGFDAQTIFQEHDRWSQEHAHPLKQFLHPHSNNRNPDRRLKIGYVSPDFNNHPVGRFLLPLLAHHDKSQFEVFAYSQTSAPDPTTQRLRSHIDHWRNIVTLTDAQAADQIRTDQIDILIDLAGHTAGNRLLVFARKPAPIQVTWLGYPNTTGLETIDYRLTDPSADPPGTTDTLIREKLIRLPDTAWCFTAPEENLPPDEKKSPGEKSITFACFNNLSKITTPMLELWARILHSTPNSTLLIKAKALASPSVEQRVQQIMQSAGIAKDRLHLQPWRKSHEQHLASYQTVDIILDTFPYHGTTTTAEALWMGLPVITLAGTTHVSRVGVSMLTNIGLPELIAHSENQYIQIAVELAHDLPRLNRLRSTLRQRMQQSPLMDAPRFARNIESAYRQMWHLWVKSNPHS
jgi:protein O-GlcNAc transferase